MAKTRLYGVAFFGVLAAITYLSLYSVPFEAPDLGFDAVDKLGHAMAYLTAMLLGCIFWSKRNKEVSFPRRHLLILGFSLFGYGMIIEALQHILPINRWAELWDVVANGFGILIGGLSFHILFNRSSVKKA